MSIKKIFPFFIIIIVSVFVLLYVSPELFKITDVDYSIFQYSGQEIIKGKLPYADFYDHKPPAIFYINALVLAIGNGSRWGIWTLEIISLSAAAILGFLFLKKYFGQLAAFLATIAFLVNLTYFHDGGNFTEEYALPFQFAALFVLSRWADGKKPLLNAFLVGLFVGIASTLKQPLGAIVLGSAAFVFIQFLADKDWKHFLKTAGMMIAGVTVVWAAWFAFFAAQGILYTFWEAAFEFNFAWSTLSTSERIAAFGNIIVTLFGKSPFFMLAMISYLVCIPAAFLSSKAIFKEVTNKWLSVLLLTAGLLGLYNGIFRRGFTLYTADLFGMRQIVEIAIGVLLVAFAWVWWKTGMRQKIRSFLDGKFSVSFEAISLPIIICAIDLPVQLGMISLSGNNFGHYFMSAMPAFSILIAFFLWFLQTKINSNLRYMWVAVFMIPMIIPATNTIIEKTRYSEDRTVKQISEYIVANTSEEDMIFLWSNMTPILIQSERESASAFYFMDPLFLKGYTSRYHTDWMLRDLTTNTPELIVAMPNVIRPFFYMEESLACDDLLDRDVLGAMAQEQFGNEHVFIPEGMPEIYQWICKNYTQVDPAFEDLVVENLSIYQYSPNRWDSPK